MIAFVVVFYYQTEQSRHPAVLSLLLDFATFVLIEKTVKEAAKIIEVIIMLIH